MMEAYVLDPTAPFPFTRDWYAERHHAPHLEQGPHQARLHKAAEFAIRLLLPWNDDYRTLCDLGAGDGGLLYLIREQLMGACRPDITKEPVNVWGYDIMPANVEYARHSRGVDVRYQDFEKESVEWGDVTVMTEVLEHLRDPYGLLRRAARNTRTVIASSPSRETPDSHDGCHAWVFDMEGYASLFERAGFKVFDHVEVGGQFQVLEAVVA